MIKSEVALQAESFGCGGGGGGGVVGVCAVWEGRGVGGGEAG